MLTKWYKIMGKEQRNNIFDMNTNSDWLQTNREGIYCSNNVLDPLVYYLSAKTKHYFQIPGVACKACEKPKKSDVTLYLGYDVLNS